MVHLRRRRNRRFTALGLALSLGLIGSATGAIKLTRAEKTPTPAESGELAKPEEPHRPPRGSKTEARANAHGRPDGTDNRVL